MRSKDEIRKEVLANLKNLLVNKKLLSKKIVDKLIALDGFQDAKKVCIYQNKSYEVNTKSLISYCLDNGKKVYAPYMSKNKIKLVEIHNPLVDADVLDDKKFYKGKIDMFVVPGMAFDHNRNRIGRGFGHYDKFLKGKTGYRVGLGFIEQIFKEVPTEEHDIKMDLVLFG